MNLCSQGHDTDECGRYENGRCKECQHERNRHRVASPKLDPAPLRDYCQRIGHARAVEAYMNRWDVTYAGAHSAYVYLRDADYIHIPGADRWCVALGLHLCLLYPELYREPVSA